MIDHLFGQAALKIEDDGGPEDAPQDQADQCALMQMGVNHVVPLAGEQIERLEAQETVKGDFVTA